MSEELVRQFLRLLTGEGMVNCRGDCKLPTAHTHGELGTMIGAERVAVNRAWDQQGEEVVELRQRCICVSGPETLRHIAEQ